MTADKSESESRSLPGQKGIAVADVQWRIECASSLDGPIAFAVSELTDYMGRITGTKPPMADSEAAGVIVIGLRKDLVEEDRASLPSPAKGFDGYAIAVKAGPDDASARIVIGSDNERAAVYAVYDLLERMGCRWFYPPLDEKDAEVIPAAEDARLDPGAWAIASPFRYRIFVFTSFEEKKPEKLPRIYDWAAKCRYNMVDDPLPEEAHKRGLLTNGGGHSFGNFLKTEDYFDEHPEWFGMRDGKRVPHVFGGAQFCWSNPEARKILADNFVKYIVKHPEIDCYGLFGGDGLPACTCPVCSKLPASDWLMLVVNEAMERVEKIRPDLLILTGGSYPPTVDPPTTYSPNPKMMLMWAHWGRHHGQSYSDPDYGRRPNLDRWTEIFESRVVPFQYYSDHFAEPWVAAPYASTIRGDRKYLLEHNAYGVTNLMYPPGYWWNSGLNNYLCGISFYRASVDPFELVRDYALRYYGPDAGALMAQYFEEWARNLELAYRVRGGAREEDRAILREQRQKYLEPAMEAVANDPVLLHRMAKIERLHTLAENLMDIHLTVQEIKRLRASGDLGGARKLLPQARQQIDETADYIQSLIDLDQGLVDRELLIFYYPRIRNSLEEEAKAVDQGSVDEKEEKRELKPEDMVPRHD